MIMFLFSYQFEAAHKKKTIRTGAFSKVYSLKVECVLDNNKKRNMMNNEKLISLLWEATIKNEK